MRQSCQLRGIEDPCGKPAVDFVVRIGERGEEYKFWLCAEHYDLLARIRKIIKEEQDEEID